MARRTAGSRKPLTAMMTRDWQRQEGEAVMGSLVVICDDGAVFSYSWMDGAWGEMAPVPGTRRDSIKSRQDAKEQAAARKNLEAGLAAWKQRKTER